MRGASSVIRKNRVTHMVRASGTGVNSPTLSTTILDGFVIIGGKANGPTYEDRGCWGGSWANRRIDWAVTSP